MKTGKILIGLALAASLFAGCAGTYYISNRPVEPVYQRPVSPYANAVWIPGEWVWQNRKYVYVNGYWARPKNNRVYVQGEWLKGGSGYYWRKGHWR